MSKRIEVTATFLATDADGIAEAQNVTPEQATGVYTPTDPPVADTTVTIGDLTYTWRDDLTPDLPFYVVIGATVQDSMDNLMAAINGDAGEGVTYGTGTTPSTQVTGDSSATNIDITAIAYGTSGNSIATTATGGTWDAATLEGGVDGFLTLDGVLVVDDVAEIGENQIVTITSSGDDSDVNFTVSGFMKNGAAISQTFVGANAGVASTTIGFAQVTSILADSPVDGNITAGISEAGFIGPIPLDINRNIAKVSLAAYGVDSSQVWYTLGNILVDEDYWAMPWFDINNGDFVESVAITGWETMPPRGPLASGSAVGWMLQPATAVMLYVEESAQATVTFTVIQQGI